MSEPPVDNLDHLKIMAGIGGVCVQWALLEHLVLGMIAANEGMPSDRAYLIFGSLDMKPRLNMAILLARDAKIPNDIVKRIEDVRKALREEKLTDRRNQAIHGVHKASGQPDSIDLTMPRWSGSRRTQTVTVMDLFSLSTRLAELGNEIWLIGEDVQAWKMRVLNNRLEHSKRQLAIANTPVILKLAKDAYASAKGFWRNIKR